MFYNPKIVIKRIKELQGDESENSMAKRLGISQVTLNYCLSGKRKPSLDLVYRICDIYGSSIDWLLGLSDDRGGSAAPAQQKIIAAQPDVLREIRELKKRVNALESSTSMATCG